MKGTNRVEERQEVKKHFEEWNSISASENTRDMVLFWGMGNHLGLFSEASDRPEGQELGGGAVGGQGGLKKWNRFRTTQSEAYAVLVLSTEFRTDRPIRTKLAGDYDNSSILRWQVRLLQIRVRNVLVTALSIVIGQFLVPRCCHITLNIFNVILFAVKSL